MRTLLYLVRHAATANNLAQPALLQGRRQNPPLHPVGVQQARVTAEFLAVRPVDAVFCSPLLRAVQTAEILSGPHNLKPTVVDGLTECDIGDWEGLSWDTVKARDPMAYKRYMDNPAQQGYKGGENFQQVLERAAAALEGIIARCIGRSILVVSHHIVNRVYVAELLGLGAARARRISLDNCAITTVVRDGEKSSVEVVNANFHLQGVVHSHGI